VSAIALGHGINANVIRKWLPRHGTTAMLPVTVEAAPAVAAARRGMHTTRGAPRQPIELTLACDHGPRKKGRAACD
jgi:transposase-like protein